MTPRRIVVTGGSGFIGTNLVASLIARGDHVLNIDVKPPVDPVAREAWCDLNLLDADGMRDRIVRFAPDAIYNLAAVADIALAAAAMLPNTQGLRNVVMAARACAVPPRLVHASTQLVVAPGHEPAHPRDFKPYTPYGESKAESENILWDDAGTLVWTIVRPATIWGPWHATFPQSIWRYLNRRWYMLPTGIDPVRSYGYVDTVVAQMLAVIDAEVAAVDHKIFYLGDEPVRSSAWLDAFSLAMTGRRTRRVPGAMLRLLATGGEVVKRVGGPAPIDRGRLYRMTTDYPVPMAETFRVLGRGPADMEQGVATTVAWLRQQYPEEYRR